MVYTQPNGQRLPTRSVLNSCVATTFDSLGWSENESQTSSEAEPQVERSSGTATERMFTQPSVSFRGRNKWVMAGTSACDATVPSNMRQSVESSRNRNNLRQRRQDDGGKKTQTNHVWLCSNISSLDKPSHCGLGAQPRAGIIFCSATACTFHCTWGSARLGHFGKTSQPSSTPGYQMPSLRDCFATGCCVWGGSVGCKRGQNLDVRLFGILIRQRLWVLA